MLYDIYRIISKSKHIFEILIMLHLHLNKLLTGNNFRTA